MPIGEGFGLYDVLLTLYSLEAVFTNPLAIRTLYTNALLLGIIKVLGNLP